MATLNISPHLKLPLEAVTQTFSILAKRGVGKTYTASVMAEEMLKAGQQIVAIDPTGAWWGLRSKFPIVVLGGEHGDVPLEESAGEIIARAIVDNRFPAVLDLSLFRKGQMHRFMTAFCESLYRLNREALHLFVDEADQFAPQDRKYGGDENRLLGAMEDIVRRGRKRGLGITLITQRPAALSKNVLTQSEILVALRMTHPRDIDAIKEWVGVHGDPELAKRMIASLPSLPAGTAWVWAPGWGDIFQQVKIRERETFDSGATPKPGEAARKPKHLASVDVAALGEQIKATVEKAKADDPKVLKARIAELEKAASKPAAVAAKKVVEVPVLKNGQLERTEKVLAHLDAAIERAQKSIEGIATSAGSLVAEAAELRKLIAPAKNLAPPARTPGRPAATPPVTRPTPPRSSPVSSKAPPAESSGLGKNARAILAVLAQFPEGCDSGKLTLLTGYRYSGGFKNALSELRTAGLIEGGNTETMTITDAGLAMGPFPDLPQGQALVDYWLNHRSLGVCESSILAALIGNPDGLTADDLCRLTNYSYSGGFKNALSKLRTAGLLVGRNTETMRASEELLAANVA